MIDWVDPDDWKALRAALEAREIVVFAGAGVSAAGGLPLWPKLTELLIERVRRLPGRALDADDAQNCLQMGRLIEAISATQHALGPVPFGNAVASLLDDTGKEVPALAWEIAALHDKLVGVVTTNIDRFLERASAGEWREVVEPVGDLGQSRGFLWKAHGTRQNRASWVFARKSYDRVMFGDPQYRATFGALYRARRLLFVGCGLADDDLDFTIGEVRALCGDQPPSHFAIVEEGMGAFRRRSLEDAGIRLITYPKGQHHKIIDLLQALRGATTGRRSSATLDGDSESSPPSSHGRAEWRKPWVGRAQEMAVLKRALVDAKSGSKRVAICALHGMAGVGKTFLAERFAWEYDEAFPGGVLRLAMDPEAHTTSASLLDKLAALLEAPAAVPRELRARVLALRALVHVDNADNETAAAAANDLARSLDGCPFIVTGRYDALGRSGGWTVVDVRPFDPETALQQLAQELEKPWGAEQQADMAELARALGYLPLALSLGAAHLNAGLTPRDFLKRLDDDRLDIVHPDPSLGDTDERRRNLQRTFALSLDLLRRSLGARGEELVEALAAFGHAPAVGVGASPGAAIMGVSRDDFLRVAPVATRLSLLEKTGGAVPKWRVHPLLAALLRTRGGAEAVQQRMTDWFVERLPDRLAESREPWNEVHREAGALVDWMGRVVVEEMGRVLDAGGTYAMVFGPYAAWISLAKRARTLCPDRTVQSEALHVWSYCAQQTGHLEEALRTATEKGALDREDGRPHGQALAAGLCADIFEARGLLDEALRIRKEDQLPIFEQLGDIRERALTMGKIADILQARGQLDEALRIRKEDQLPIFERLSDIRSRALTMGQIADIFEARGQLDEALRIRKEDQLPIFEQLGDIRSRALTMGKIADIFEARGQLDEALRIRKDDQLPIFEQLGDIRSRALTMGKIADILQARGQLDEALRIRKEDQLPIFEQLGDIRSRALTMGQIADILQARGQLDEALRIRKGEELPVYEQLGDIRSRALTMGKIADILQARGQLDEALRIRKEDQLPIFEQLGDIRSRALTMGNIADILMARGLLDEALRIRKEDQLPIFEQLGDIRSRALTMGQIADILQARGQLDEALRIRKDEELPVYEQLGDIRSRAVTMGQIADILQARGQLDEALRIRKDEELPVYEQLGDIRSRALTVGKIADILQARGQLDEALRIRKDEELPVYELLGDIHSRAVTMGQIADILQARGQLDEALRIRKEDQLPIFEQLGDIRSRAVTMGKIADILQARGQLDEALRIRKEDQLPIFEQLGDIRSRALTMGNIADILMARGQVDEALRIYREQVLPVYERLDERVMLVVDRANLAVHLLRRGKAEDRDEAESLLRLALLDAQTMGLLEAQTIRSLLHQAGFDPLLACPLDNPQDHLDMLP